MIKNLLFIVLQMTRRFLLLAGDLPKLRVLGHSELSQEIRGSKRARFVHRKLTARFKLDAKLPLAFSASCFTRSWCGQAG